MSAKRILSVLIAASKRMICAPQRSRREIFSYSCFWNDEGIYGLQGKKTMPAGAKDWKPRTQWARRIVPQAVTEINEATREYSE